MDAFYASIEQLDRPELRGRCVIVGGDSDRGVVTTASYEARRFGVHSAMPMFRARQLCPKAIVVPPRMDRYKEVSGRIMEILAAVSPVVEKVSIDEAYLDLAGLDRLRGGPERVASDIKREIREATGLTCSIGGASLKFLSKIASDMQKPDGLTLIGPGSVLSFIETLPVSRVSGVGRVATRRLAAMGIHTMGDVRAFPEKPLTAALGRFGFRLKELATGIDRSPVVGNQPVKSISSEETLAFDTDDKETLRRLLLEQSETVGRQLRRHGFMARTVVLKLKHADFRLITRSSTLANPTQSNEIIYHTSTVLLDRYPLRDPVRLVGAGVSNLIPAGTPVQMPLFRDADPEPGSAWDRLDPAVDRIREKFGDASIRKAATLEEAATRRKGSVGNPGESESRQGHRLFEGD
jgi:DNA polymerase-4